MPMNRRLFVTTVIITSCIGIILSAFSLLSMNYACRALKDSIIENCTNETVRSANQMSNVLEKSEGTVDALAATVYSTFDLDGYRNDPDYMDSYLDELNPIIRNSLGNLSNTVGLFFTVNVELVSDEGYEIWYVYDDEGNIYFLDAAENGVYLEAFSDYDAEYMQYYFKAIEAQGEGVWVGPIYDPDIDQNILSYAKAVFVDDTLIGVVGTDINTKNTTDLIMAVEPDSKGEIALFNQKGQVIVDSFEEDDDKLRKSMEGLFDNPDSPAMKKSNGHMQRKVDGDDMTITYARLSNDWLLTIANENSVIFSPVTLVRITIAFLALVVIVLLIIIIRYVLKKYNTPVEEAMGILKVMGFEGELSEKARNEIENEEDIEALAKKLVEIQRNRDIMMAHQSRLAQSGEMMAAIAHQWKQPLNSINIIQGNILDDYLHGEMTQESLREATEKTEQLTRFMSETIDNFNRYMKPESEAADFEVCSLIKSAAALMTDSFKKNKVSFEFSPAGDIEFTGYPSALYHALINVLTNAVDALKDVPADRRSIRIDISEDEEQLKIFIFNSGNPVPDDIMNEVFEPYFTTKGEEGTGLGLPISRSILEKTMRGSIALTNEQNGVLCTIIIPEGGDDIND